MLTSLLPGLRELRAPLAAGYLWLITLWLTFHGSISAPTAAHPGVVHDVYELAAAVGRPAAAAAAAFAAYVVGLLSVQATAMALPALRALRGRPLVGRGRVLGVASPSKAGADALEEAVLDELALRCAVDRELKRKLEDTLKECAEERGVDEPAVRRAALRLRIDVQDHAKQVKDDLPLVPLRLMAEGKEHQVYGEFDRLRAEAEFRAATAMPLVAVAVVLAVRVSAWWTVALMIPVLLIVEAVRNVTEAADVLAEAVRARVVSSPALAAVQTGSLHERNRDDWLSRAAAENYVGAMLALAEERCNHGRTTEAEDLYRRAAGAGAPSAMFSLAGLLHMRQDPESEYWYERAAACGDKDAAQIGKLGGLSPQELNDLRSAYAGDVNAMYRTGELFERRPGQLEAAKQWYCRAVWLGDDRARESMVRILDAAGMAAADDFRRPIGALRRDRHVGPQAVVPDTRR